MVTRSLENTVNDLSISTKILGFHISGFKTVIVYGDMNGFIYERLQGEISAEMDFLEAFDALCSQADKLLKICRAQGLSNPEVISLAISGSVDVSSGIVSSPPDLPNWGDAQLKGRLGVRYNLPVLIEHRSNAAALAEYHFGAGIGAENLIFVDLEPVVSVGLLLAGSIYRGANYAAGEIGYMRFASEGPSGLGLPGSLTGFASGLGLAELAHMRYPKRWPKRPSPYHLVKAANEGESEALAVLTEAASPLGQALLWLIFAIDPDLIVFGHPGDVLGEALLQPLRDAILRYGGAQARQLPRLSVSKLGAKLDDTAALMAVVDPFKKRKTL
jgi:glucokinase